tara:strand:- start:625 stop:849 length:225 start_codon:yes stop_codon:yes gene_type:complete
MEDLYPAPSLSPLEDPMSSYTRSYLPPISEWGWVEEKNENNVEKGNEEEKERSEGDECEDYYCLWLVDESIAER